MADWIVVALIIYGSGVATGLITGIIGFTVAEDNSDRKISARFLILSWVWPVVAFIGAVLGIIHLFQLAFPEED